MYRIITLLLFVASFGFAQDYDFQELCIECAESEGYYCGDDPSNWTQYAPNGCVINQWLNDGWLDCVDGSDENGAVPTSPLDCAPPVPECDTVFIEIPFVEWIYDTVEVEVPFYIYETIIQLATIIETQYVEILVTDTVIEYVEIINTEYIDCETGMPCNSAIQEVVDKSKNTGLIYNLKGQAIKVREGLYIENGKIKYKL